MRPITPINTFYSPQRHFRQVADDSQQALTQMLSYTPWSIPKLVGNRRFIHRAYRARVAAAIIRDVRVDLVEVILDLYDEFRDFDNYIFNHVVDQLVTDLELDTGPHHLPL